MRLRRLRIGKWILTIALVSIPIYAVCVAPRRVVVTRHEPVLDGLPSSLDGLRVVHMSDIHLSICIPDQFVRDAVDTANSLRPDIVVITGDFISRNARNARPCGRMVGELDPPLGVYAVLGNHDHWVDAEEVRRSLEAEAVTVLMNKNTRIAKGLWLAGVDDIWAGTCDAAAARKGIRADSALIVLSHNPAALAMFSRDDCLVLSGHTHGGHVNLPYLARGVSRLTHAGGRTAGWYKQGRARMYVNRGLGGAPLRLRARPEIALFTLRSRPAP